MSRYLILDVTMERRQYRSPPIEEAVCEIQFAPGAQADFAAPARFYDQIKQAYPGKPESQQLVAAQFRVEPRVSSSQVAMRQEGIKILFPDAQRRRLVGLGRDLLSVHDLRPYSGWESFRPRIEEALKAYQTVGAPIGVKRIAVRYINRIQIRQREVHLGEFLTVAPDLPDDLPLTLTSFVSRVESVYPDGPKLILTVASAEPDAPETIAILLDVDLNREWSSELLPVSEIMVHVDDLRQRERTAFESFITDRAREIFDGKNGSTDSAG